MSPTAWPGQLHFSPNQHYLDGVRHGRWSIETSSSTAPISWLAKPPGAHLQSAGKPSNHMCVCKTITKCSQKRIPIAVDLVRGLASLPAAIMSIRDILLPYMSACTVFAALVIWNGGIVLGQHINRNCSSLPHI